MISKTWNLEKQSGSSNQGLGEISKLYKKISNPKKLLKYENWQRVYSSEQNTQERQQVHWLSKKMTERLPCFFSVFTLTFGEKCLFFLEIYQSAYEIKWIKCSNYLTFEFSKSNNIKYLNSIAADEGYVSTSLYTLNISKISFVIKLFALHIHVFCISKTPALW